MVAQNLCGSFACDVSNVTFSLASFCVMPDYFCLPDRDRCYKEVNTSSFRKSTRKGLGTVKVI